jgi:hypothetical protein
VERMLAVVRAIFFEFQFLLDIAPVLAGGIITPFTFTALQSYQLHRRLFACHFSNLSI